MHRIVNDETLFRTKARPEAKFDRPVGDTLPRALAELTRLGPSSCGAESHLIFTAQALGLDCRPIWEFDAHPVNPVFFPDSGSAADFRRAFGHASAATRAASGIL